MIKGVAVEYDVEMRLEIQNKKWKEYYINDDLDLNKKKNKRKILFYFSEPFSTISLALRLCLLYVHVQTPEW